MLTQAMRGIRTNNMITRSAIVTSSAEDSYGYGVRRYMSTPHQHATSESHCASFCKCGNPLRDGEGDCVYCGRIIPNGTWRAA